MQSPLLFNTVLQFLEQACSLVELVDEFIHLGSFLAESAPCVFFVIPQSIDLVNSLALLLDPCVVLEVVDPLAILICQLNEVVILLVEDVLVVVESSLLVSVLALLILELLDPGLVHNSGVCHYRCQYVILCQFIVLGHLDAAEQVGYAADAEVSEEIDEFRINSLLLEVVASDLLIEESEEVLRILIVDSDDHVSILDVVDPWNVLVADSFDPVSAESVVEECRALQSFTYCQLSARIELFQSVAEPDVNAIPKSLSFSPFISSNASAIALPVTL